MKKYKFYKKNKDNFLKCKYELETEECVPKEFEKKNDIN
jgi:hypothetical protein